jgi:hypothetical protein
VLHISDGGRARRRGGEILDLLASDFGHGCGIAGALWFGDVKM